MLLGDLGMSLKVQVTWETTTHCYAVFGITPHRGSNLGIFDAGVVKFLGSTTFQWFDLSDTWLCHKKLVVRPK